ncbi:MAG: dihydroorotate dehydrogenase [Candidatus Theseobacter exili]|nr:dihydroorotate dehydrogenase [Candidatus Theseobacter exili]
MNDLSVQIGKVLWKNPVSVASGTFGCAEEMSEIMDIGKLGAIFAKGLTLKPRSGNPPQRIIETPAGMLNAIGLQNVGVDEFIKNKIPFLANFDVPVYANISGNSEHEYSELAKKLDGSGIAGIEINVSCPNVKKGGMAFGLDPDLVASVTRSVRKSTELDVIVKLSPNVTDISLMAKRAEQEGADAVSLVNTFMGLAIDINQRRPYLANNTGGLSGPAIRPIAVRMVWEVYNSVSIPIIGMGGIVDTDSALEFIIAGATALSVGTGTFYDPLSTVKIVKGINQYFEENNYKKIIELVGSLVFN